MSVKTVADSYWTHLPNSPQQVCSRYVHEPSDRRSNKVNMMNRHCSDWKRVILLEEVLDLRVCWRPRALDPEESVDICVLLKVREQQVSGVTSNCCDYCSKEWGTWTWIPSGKSKVKKMDSIIRDYSRIITNFFKLKVQNVTSVSICSCLSSLHYSVAPERTVNGSAVWLTFSRTEANVICIFFFYGRVFVYTCGSQSVWILFS